MRLFSKSTRQCDRDSMMINENKKRVFFINSIFKKVISKKNKESYVQRTLSFV